MITSWGESVNRAANAKLSRLRRLSAGAVDGGRTRTRTLDPLIKSQLLYQLSYAP